MVEWLNEPALHVGGYTITRLEVLGDLTGLASVWWATRENVLTWPIGIVNNLLFLVLFVDNRLYLSGTLQIAFLALGVYGWLEWRRTPRGDDPATKIRRATSTELAVLGGASVVGVAVLTVATSALTDAAHPFWDATVLVLSLAATYGQARKLIEFWVVFLVVDIISVPLYLSQGLLPTAVLFGVLGMLCVLGLAEWSRLHRADPAGAT